MIDWEECIDSGFIKKIEVDNELINALISSSKDRITSNNKLELDETTSSTKISITYEALREILEALAIIKEYKIYNHECFYSFLKEICKEESLAEEFNRFRIVRNKVNYYAKKISIEKSEAFIKEMINLRIKILNKYFAK